MCQGIMQLANALIYGDRLQCGSSDVANAKLIMLSNSKPLQPWLEEVLDSSRAVIFINTGTEFSSRSSLDRYILSTNGLNLLFQ